MPSTKSENINNTFFDGFYKDIWKAIIPEKLTIAEVEFMEKAATLKQGDKILDIMCGYGRHAIALARKGYEVTAVDNLSNYMNEIKKIANTDNLVIECIEKDVIYLELEHIYDLSICMGNSLSFFDYDDTIKLMSNISSHLKQGGLFIINTWAIAEIAIKQFQEKSWGYVHGLKMLSDSKYLFDPTRIETENIFIGKDGSSETKKAIDYIFSYAELQEMLNKTGFIINEAYSIPGKKKFTLGDPRLYIVAEKNA